MRYEAWHECQTCGDRLRKMTDAEKQAVAVNPYNYVFYCYNCIREGWAGHD